MEGDRCVGTEPRRASGDHQFQPLRSPEEAIVADVTAKPAVFAEWHEVSGTWQGGSIGLELLATFSAAKPEWDCREPRDRQDNVSNRTKHIR